MKAWPAAAIALIAAAPAQSAFNPVEFFRGKTHGEGMLKIIFQSPKKMTVDSAGRSETDGSLVLEQVVHEPGKPPRTRYWRMRQAGPDRFEGTLTDAASPVRVDVTKDGIRIRYTATNHLNFDQLLTPVSATEVHDEIKITRFGITVAHFDETIRKTD
ncbi:MAG TPA: DUF3833 family protein [Sphingomicrobium sp.]|nr:DUF3833 family protein [Sphingomicrobium sp.]